MIPVWAQWVGVVALVMLVVFRCVDVAVFARDELRAIRKVRAMREFERELHERVGEAARRFEDEAKVQAERELN